MNLITYLTERRRLNQTLPFGSNALFLRHFFNTN